METLRIHCSISDDELTFREPDGDDDVLVDLDGEDVYLTAPRRATLIRFLIEHTPGWEAL